MLTFLSESSFKDDFKVFQALAPRMMKLLPFAKKGKDTERKVWAEGKLRIFSTLIYIF